MGRKKKKNQAKNANHIQGENSDQYQNLPCVTAVA